jgi:predicted GNAT superfamily acetyltransferase
MTAVVVDQEYVPAGTGKILLRRIAAPHEYTECEVLQREIWGEQGMSPASLRDMMTAQHNGGLVLGAFAPNDELIGFVFSFPGISRGGLLMQCSVVAAVRPAWQNLGIGYRLKQFQARLAAEAGFDLITWTFDPLSGRNARFNLTMLGAVGVEYMVNAYGVGFGLQAGLETDRLLVTWTLPPTGSGLAVPYQGGEVVNEFTVDERRLPHPGDHTLSSTADMVLAHVPWNVYTLCAADRDLAVRWRTTSRAILAGYLERGYQAVGIRPSKAAGMATYLLCRGRQ